MLSPVVSTSIELRNEVDAKPGHRKKKMTSKQATQNASCGVAKSLTTSWHFTSKESHAS